MAGQGHMAWVFQHPTCGRDTPTMSYTRYISAGPLFSSSFIVRLDTERGMGGAEHEFLGCKGLCDIYQYMVWLFGIQGL